jgi:hypothetical protein
VTDVRRACVHVGTHKTGSTALQVFLAMNRQLLLDAGVCYPRSGRVGLGENLTTPGHHQIAMDMLADRGSSSLENLVLEIRSSDVPTVVLSSEEFAILAAVPDWMARLKDALLGAGYAPVAIVYLRAQPFYAESVFAEMAKNGYLVDIDAYLAGILADGHHTPPGSGRSMMFDYEALMAKLEGTFGPGEAVARAYRPDLDSAAIFRDFLGVVGNLRGGLKVQGLKNPMPRVNESQTLRQLIASIAAIAPEKHLELSHYPDAELDARFGLLTYDDVANAFERFRGGNAALNQRFNIEIPFANDAHAPRRDDPRFERAPGQRALLGRIIDALGLQLMR